MSPRHFAKKQINQHFLNDLHYIDDRPKKVSRIRKFINLLRTPAKMEFEHLPYQTRPEVPEAEVEAAQAEEPQPIDLKALREKRRVEKQSDQ